MFNKHYIRVNEEDSIIKIFSDAFEQPEETDICINEDAGRHFQNLNGKPIIYINGCFTFKYDGNSYIERTQEEVEATTEYASYLSNLAIAELSATDADMARITEDLYEFVVNDVPIPQEAIDKIANRKVKRSQLK